MNANPLTVKTPAIASTDLLPLIILGFCLMCSLGCSDNLGHAEELSNDVVAYILPLKADINIDGELSDWPAKSVKHPIANLEIGDSINNPQDYQAYFQIGYNLRENAIYIGVAIKDQSTVIDTTSAANWNTQDGAELYLDENYLKSGSPVTQYSAYGNQQLTFGDKDNWDNVEMKKSVSATGRTYEWKLTLEDPLEIGRALGLDLVVTDMDEDNSFSWISWTRGTQKTTNPERCGTVVIAAADIKTHRLKGNLDMTALTSTQFPVPIRINSTQNEKLWLRVVPDSIGNYEFLVPAGTYKLEIPSEIVEWDYRYYRIAHSESATFEVAKGEITKLPVIRPDLHPEPALWSPRGILHEFGDSQQEKLDKFIASYQEYYNIPGVSLALIKDGKLVYHKTYGVKNTHTKGVVDENTLFEAASITKPVFAYVVLRLAEKGVINLDKPLYEYLPFEALEAFPEYKKMTARHVLIHRSGLPNWGQTMINIPGEKFGYSGEGFEYLKRVVVKLSDKTIEEILDEELIKPFGLYNMLFSDSPELRKVVADGHIMGDPTDWGIPQEAGMAFSMHTEARAFSKFVLLLLAKKGLSPQMYKEFMTIHTLSNSEFWNDKNKQEGAGLGIFIRETDFGNTFYHGGNNGDFKCHFELFQDLKMGYIIFTNSDTGSELANDLTYFLVEGNAPE